MKVELNNYSFIETLGNHHNQDTGTLLVSSSTTEAISLAQHCWRQCCRNIFNNIFKHKVEYKAHIIYYYNVMNEII